LTGQGRVTIGFGATVVTSGLRVLVCVDRRIVSSPH
jgi:hypothetical protein